MLLRGIEQSKKALCRMCGMFKPSRTARRIESSTLCNATPHYRRSNSTSLRCFAHCRISHRFKDRSCGYTSLFHGQIRSNLVTPITYVRVDSGGHVPYRKATQLNDAGCSSSVYECVEKRGIARGNSTFEGATCTITPYLSA